MKAGVKGSTMGGALGVNRSFMQDESTRFFSK